ncbi:hypothetical protein HDG40_004080 [Paraburkholderia sp. JPY158]|uniref:Uncharacterized protein n=1 Tax=Paraburkholderia atlantica TaxID=2654982 RepID=A0A7W8UZM4_PARAM|nr:hypothetical protein [Paraburkholderia atlantica]MBB5425907.1 hypothetical protein [Paraburkholderia atlantica]
MCEIPRISIDFAARAAIRYRGDPQFLIVHAAAGGFRLRVKAAAVAPPRDQTLRGRDIVELHLRAAVAWARTIGVDAIDRK